MKKTISLFATLLLLSVGAKAQDESESDDYLFTHLGGSISVGTDGIGIDVAAPITPYVSVRAGVSFFPRIKYTKDDVKYTRNGVQGHGSVEAKLNKIDGGIVKTIDGDDWLVTPDPETGMIDLRLRTNSVKPYLGVGFGRAIPKKRLNVAFDLGVQFHGTPQVQGLAAANGQTQWTDLGVENFDSDYFGQNFVNDLDDALKIVHKVKVWPVLNIRLTGRFF